MKTTPLASKIKTPINYKFNYKFIMGWLFIISFMMVPLCWLLSSNMYVLLASICFFGLMLSYQCIETFYDDYKIKKNIREFEELKRRRINYDYRKQDVI